MSDIYDQHRAAFDQVSAYVILRGGERVATVALKFPKDGAGRLFAYVHFIGLPMVRAYAGGYGYDKRTAAVIEAARKIGRFDYAEDAQRARNGGHTAAAMQYELSEIARNEMCDRFKAALATDSGHDWTRLLEMAGFEVMQAV